MNGCRILLCFGLFAVCAGPVCFSPAFAQSNACPSDQSTQTAQQPQTKVIVDQVEFRGDNPLTASQRADLLQEIQKEPYVLTPDEPQDEWAIEATEVMVRGTFQDLGYMKVDPHGTPYLNRASGSELHFTLAVEVRSGPQYRLGKVRLTGTKDKPLAFSEGELRQQLDLKTGDLFNASKIRSAMEKITRLYSSKGYLDQVPEPRMDFDEKDSLIDLTLQIDEGLAYRISGIDVFGNPRYTSQTLAMPQSIGDLVDEPA